MEQQTFTGTITFIHHDKQYATIEYTKDGKKKTINGSISEKDQQKLKEQKIIKRTHHYNIGDVVSFIITLSLRGDKMVADCMQYLYNNALDNLINKSTIENRFVGYLKKVNDYYFVKETGSYILFPLILSPWEKKPQEDKLNEPIFFRLDNIENPEKVTASLFRSEYIHEYQTAMQYFNRKEAINAIVYNITPFGIFVNLIGEKIQAKIPLKKNDINIPEVKIGDYLKVRIIYVGHTKIVIEMAP